MGLIWDRNIMDYIIWMIHGIYIYIYGLIWINVGLMGFIWDLYGI